MKLKPSFSNTGRFVSFKKNNGQEDILEKNLPTKQPNTRYKNSNYISNYYNLIDNRMKNYKRSIHKFENIIEKSNNNLIFQYNTIFEHDQETNLLDCQIENINKRPKYFLTLNNHDHAVYSIEHLLSALEALSIDNIEIQMENNSEIPIFDGSSMGWVNILQKNEVLPSISSSNLLVKDNYLKKARKFKFGSNRVLSLCDNDSFITYYPDKITRITVGLDYSLKSPIIGKQWYSYTVHQDDHYKWDIGSARMYIKSFDELYKAKDLGYFSNGIENCVNLPVFDRWVDDDQIRYLNSECARHEILDLIGALGLLNYNGNGGLPYGHIVAYKPNLELMVKFTKMLKENIII